MNQKFQTCENFPIFFDFVFLRLSKKLKYFFVFHKNFRLVEKPKTNMGYDDGECVQCCFQRNGNVGAERRGDLCLECLHQFSSNSEAISGRLVHVLRQKMDYGTSKCYHCNQECSIWVYVSVCDNCLPEEEESPVYAEMFRRYEGSPIGTAVSARLIEDFADAEEPLGEIATGRKRPTCAMDYDTDCNIFVDPADCGIFSFEELKFFVLWLFVAELDRKSFKMRIDEEMQRIYVELEPELFKPLCFTRTRVCYESQLE